MAKPGIVASAGGVIAKPITPVRPSWKDMIASYPGEDVKTSDFYAMVSPEWASLAKEKPLTWSNSCAGRMSYALNRSGIELKKAPGGGSMKGKDGKNYWFRVKDLKNYLKERFGKGDVEHTLTALPNILTKEVFDTRVEEINTNVLSKVNGKHGIMVFEVSGWEDASGHFTLWDGKNLVYVGPGDHNNPKSAEYYFWLTRFKVELTEDKEEKYIPTVRTTKVIFWELK